MTKISLTSSKTPKGLTLQQKEDLADDRSSQLGLVPPTREVRDIKKIDAQLRAFSREPFRFVLAEMLACAPTQDALTQFSDTHPDRWAQALRSLAILSGYHEKLEIEHNISVEIMGKSDAELMLLLEDKKPQLEELGLLIEGTKVKEPEIKEVVYQDLID